MDLSQESDNNQQYVEEEYGQEAAPQVKQDNQPQKYLQSQGDNQILAEGDQASQENLQLIDSFFSQLIFERGPCYANSQQIGADASCQLREEVPQLIQLLHNERMAADLLPYQGKLVQQILMLIGQQERAIQTKMDKVQGQNDAGRSGNGAEFQLGSGADTDDHFASILLKMDLERVKFSLKSYLRARISKIERHILFIIEKDQSQLLSDAEMQFAFELYTARKNVLEETVFKQLPQKLNFMAKDPIDDQYIQQPNLEQMVFVRILAQIDEHYAIKEHIQVELRQFQVYYVPYSGIKKLLEEGKAELL